MLFAAGVGGAAPAAAAAASASFLTLAAVAAEGPRRGELAQLVADHVFGHEHLHVQLAVVNHERVADELRHDRAGAGPGLDRLFPVDRIHRSTFWNSFGSTNGPFFSERPMIRFRLSACRLCSLLVEF